MTGSDPHGEYGARIDAIIERPGTSSLVGAYFKSDGPFAADSFDKLGFNDPHAVGADDLLACTFLDVRYPPLAVRQLLGDERDTVGALLADVPPHTDLWEATDEQLAAAKKVWNLFRTHRGVNWVMAGKLMARKRPRLIPVLDSVVTGALQFPSGTYWPTLRECLRCEGRRTRIEALRPAGITSDVTVLRLLDVAIWMHHSESTNARNARLEIGLPVAPRRPRRSPRGREA